MYAIRSYYAPEERPRDGEVIVARTLEELVVPADDGICITLVPTGGGDRCAFEPLPLAVAVARNRKEAEKRSATEGGAVLAYLLYCSGLIWPISGASLSANNHRVKG